MMPSVLLTTALLICALYNGEAQGRFQALPQLNPGQCAAAPNCDPKAKFRSADGSCTNVKNPAWGRATLPYLRTAAAVYADGKSEFRKSICKKGQALPNARDISVLLFKNKQVLDHVNTLNVMQWGQNVAHDVTRLSLQQTGSNVCCTSDNKVPRNVPRGCMTMPVSKDDPFYKQFKVQCIFQNSAVQADKKTTCNKPAAEQVNVNTPVIDASFVYGSSQAVAQTLRAGDGKMRVGKSSTGKDFLPPADNNTIPCSGNLNGERTCYRGGDDRVNLNSGITVYTVAFVRYHNKIVSELKKLNPSWKDERLYQEARKIVGAFFQHITFKNYLPIILGKEFMLKKGLLIKNSEDHCHDFHDPEINPSTYNEFSGAAYRSFHSLIPQQMFMFDETFKTQGSINLDDFFFRPGVVEQNKKFDGFLRGLAKQEVEQQDSFFATALTNKLFKLRKPWGGDLEATDTSRNRDLGLVTYNEMRAKCGMKQAKTFDDFGKEMSKESIKELKRLYACPDDVDLFVGGMQENLLPKALVGPTFQCIIGEQFYRYMHGDRFYYENCGKPWSFSKAQLKAIYESSLASMFCDIGDSITTMPKNTFFKADKVNNPFTPCKKIKSLDLRAWKEH